jgi:hypothetical protein
MYVHIYLFLFLFLFCLIFIFVWFHSSILLANPTLYMRVYLNGS